MLNVSWKKFSSGVAAGAVLALAVSSLAFAGDRDDDDKGDDLRISTLSTRPDTVSGGDVLVRIDVPRKVSMQSVRVELNGANISGAFRADAAARTLTGLVTGLKLGENTLEASVSGKGDGRSERLTLTNHPISGPIFSGPQQQPFACESSTFVLPVTGGTPGAALDANCSIATRVDYVYKSTAGPFKPLPIPSQRPADLAQTTTTAGRTVNYVVRVQTGTINRAIYQIAMLHDPVTDPAPDLWTRTRGWNGRLVYSFGGGCNASYHQGRNTGGVVNDLFLSRGYAVAASSLNTFGNKCDDVVSAETMMMVKERFVEQFGVPRHTIGTGASGGSMQQHLIAHNYPGLLDGIQPSLSFPDTLSFSLPYMDCGLIDRAFNTSSVAWTVEQKTAVAGHSTYAYCTSNFTWSYRFVNPKNQCDTGVPAALVYNPATNPGGARCTLADDMVNVYGRDPKTGFARRPYDNTGLQYGLIAFNSGRISADQFLDLNERIGGYDIDGNPVPNRMVADPEALRIAYRTGRMNSGGVGLASVPIIDFRRYLDDSGNVHDAIRSYISRARLIAANGSADNQVILVAENTTPASNKVAEESLRLMEEWLENIAGDHSPYHSKAEKVVRNKPRELVDACYTASLQKITDPAECKRLFPPLGNPRLAAGEPLTNNFLKCQLRPVRRSDYTRPLADAQFARLKSIFEDGVCDYSEHPVGQREAQTWLAYPRPGKSVRLDNDGDDRGDHDDDRDRH
jgi:hypothetical protein